MRLFELVKRESMFPRGSIAIGGFVVPGAVCGGIAFRASRISTDARVVLTVETLPLVLVGGHGARWYQLFF